MRLKILLSILSVLLISCVNSSELYRNQNDVGNIPEPTSWAFPGVIESAREIAPKNIEGKVFNKFGLVYSLKEYSRLDVASIPASELQKYADVVTYAYPDAVSRQFPPDCGTIPLNKVNGATVAGVAYVSIHALQESVRNASAKCLTALQNRIRKNAFR